MLGLDQPAHFALADMNGDGHADLVMGSALGEVFVSRWVGPNTFSAPTSIPGVSVAANAAPAVGDINGDGLLDLVVGSANGALKIWHGAAGGNFVLQAANGIDIGDFSMPALGDLDGDGDLDLAVGSSGNLLNIYRNNGAGGFDMWTSALFFVATNVSPAIADLDGDGDNDILIGQQTGSYLAYIYQSGFIQTDASNVGGWDVGDNSSAAFGDVDGDGDSDLVLVSQGSGVTSVYPYLNSVGQSVVTVTVNAQAEPAPPPPTLSDVATSVTFAENTVNATAQFLDADVTFTDPASRGGTLTVSGLLAEDRVGVGSTGWITESGGELFYDGDGDGDGSSILIGTVSGGVGATLTINLNAVGPEIVERVIEALTYANTSDTPTAARDLNIGFTAADGDAAFVPTFDWGGYGAGVDLIPSIRLTAGDLGGGQDELVAGRTDGTITNAFGGVISRVAGIDVGTNAAPVLLDWDGDGDDDLFVGAGDGTIHYFRNAGGSYVEVVGANNPFNGMDFGDNAAPAFGDIDGDGDLDLLVSHSGGIVWRINTSGVFSGGGAIASAWGGAAIAPGDLDGDHRPDLLVGTGGEELRGYRLNYSGGVLSIGAQLSVPPTGGVAVNGVTFGDFDGDGYDDLAALGGSNLWWFRNAPQWGRTITVNVTAESDPILGTAGHDTLWGSPDEDIICGLGGNDVLHGMESDDLLEGGAGNDVLYGYAGDDALWGGAGNDQLFGGPGLDMLAGGAGNDRYTVHGADDIIVELAGEGTDTVYAAIDWTLEENVENLTLTNADPVTGRGNALANVITGNFGGNTLYGEVGNDTLYGAGGSDRLYGGDGVDRLEGGDDADFLEGEAGNDTLIGGAGRDTAVGGDGNDVLDGGDDNDQLYGGKGADTLTGNFGADMLRGDWGRDILTGGAGADSFVFTITDIAATAELDKILDYNRAEGDVIDLSGIDANANLAGDQAFTWAANNVFTKTAGQIVIKFVLGKPTVQLDVNGDGKADFQIELGGAAHGLTENGTRGRGGGWVPPTDGWVL